MDRYLFVKLLLILPRHERYLVLLPPHLLTRPELVTALRANVRRQEHLARWEEQLIEAARARGLDPAGRHQHRDGVAPPSGVADPDPHGGPGQGSVARPAI